MTAWERGGLEHFDRAFKDRSLTLLNLMKFQAFILLFILEISPLN